LVIPLCLILFPIIAGYLYLDYAAKNKLQAAIAETDRLDPRWRLEDIEADRAAVPDAENSAKTVLAAQQLIPKNWPVWEFPTIRVPQAPPEADPKLQALAKGFRELEPQQQLNDEESAALRSEMMRAAAALTEARKLAALSEGRYPIVYSPDCVSTLLPHVQKTREIAGLLSRDAQLRVQDKDTDGALTSCGAALNAGRSLGDEPVLISQLVRTACRHVVTGQAERVLAQGQPSDAALKEFQQLLEKEDRDPLLLIGVRGERAGYDRMMENVAAGKIKTSPRDLMRFFCGTLADSRLLIDEELRLWTPGFMAIQRTAMLRYLDRAVELARLPPEQRHEPLQRLGESLRGQFVLVRTLAPVVAKGSDADQRSHAQLLSTIAAIAAERYRLAKSQWPDSLDALQAAGFLREVPNDPYDGKPLRWRRLDDGLVIYSVGPDGEDNGGKMDRQNPNAPGTDIGFRLWDPAKRRQPPAPLQPPANDLP
jgi:hypothetical protein